MSKQSGPAPASKKARAPGPAGSRNTTASTVAGGQKATGSSVEPAPSGTNFATVSTMYTNIWSVTPYTSYVMFDYLVKTAPVGASPLESWGTFLASQKPSLAEAGLKTVAAPTDRDQALWNGPSGLCTSFTIRVATEAKMADIQYGNQRRKRNGILASVHRAGWETSGTSAIVIDSSARQAIQFIDTSQPFTKKDPRNPRNNTEWRFQGEVLTQTVSSGATPFEPCLPKGPEGWKCAMQICLDQLLPQQEMLLMFRSAQGSKLGFAGTVRWNFQEHTCTFSTLKDKDVSVITFAHAQIAESSTPPADHTSGPGGASGAHIADPTAATQPPTPAQIVGFFLDWIQRVPQRVAQFTPQIKSIHIQLWQAAITSWGPPSYQYIPGEEPKGRTQPASQATGSGAAPSGAKSQNAKAPVDLRTAPGTQPVPGGLSGQLLNVGVHALTNVKK